MDIDINIICTLYFCVLVWNGMKCSRFILNDTMAHPGTTDVLRCSNQIWVEYQ